MCRWRVRREINLFAKKNEHLSFFISLANEVIKIKFYAHKKKNVGALFVNMLKEATQFCIQGVIVNNFSAAHFVSTFFNYSSG